MKHKLLLFGVLALFTFGCGELDTGAASEEAGLEPAAPGEIWYGDPNKPWRDVFVNFNREDNGGTNPTVISTTDRRHGKIWRVHKPVGARRAEMSRAKGYNQREGETIYIGWRWKIDIKNANPTNGFAVFQWKSEGQSRQNYPFVFIYKDGTLALQAFGPGKTTWDEGGSIQRRRNTLWKKSVAEGQWVDIVLGVKVSKYDGNDLSRKGYVELWLDGQKQTLTPENGQTEYDVTLSSDRKRAYHRTNDGSLTYPKWGAYGGGAIDYSVYTYFDEMKIARNYSAAAPGGGGGNYVLELRARGKSGSERVGVEVGGKRVATFNLTRSARTYRAATSTRGDLRVRFLNDNGEGRDAYVDWVAVNGKRRQAEAQGSNTAAWGNGRCGGGAYTEVMSCNGYINFGGVAKDER